MPPLRTNISTASPVHASLAFTFASSPGFQLDSQPLSSPFPDHYSPSSSPAKKKRSHGKARPPGHIPRPPNAFIIFRTETIKSEATHSTPEMSKSLGEKWKNMTAHEKRPYIDKAREAKEEHRKQYPDYKYKPVHPRDAEGRCIRKRRKPNQSRIQTVPNDAVDHSSSSFAWTEGKHDAEFPSSALPSDCSTASSPPRSPSPVPSPSQSQPSYLPLRRSSSVPLPGGDDRNYFGMFPPQNPFVYQPSSSTVRRFSKRPSTSMDFACAGPIPEYSLPSNSNQYLAAPNDFAQWRRRSISVPTLGGDILNTQFVNSPTQEPSQEPQDLTPINPVFRSVFDKFSWDATSNTHYPSTIVPPQHPYTGLDIPPMTHSPLSNGSATPPASTPEVSPSSPYRPRAPTIQHPTPVPTFDLGAFEAQLGDFDVAPNAEMGPVSVPQQATELGNALGFDSHSYQIFPAGAGQERQVYPVEQQQGELLYEDGQIQSAESTQAQYSLAADINGYEEGLRYTQPAQSLDFNELIIEGYL